MDNYTVDELFALGLEYERISYKNDDCFKRAVKYFEKAIELGKKEASLNLAQLFNRKWLSDVSQKEYFLKAEKYFIMYEKDGFIDDMSGLSRLYYRNFVYDKKDLKNFEKLIGCYVANIEKGVNIDHMYYMLGQAYLLKWKEDKDKLEIFELAEKNFFHAIDNRNVNRNVNRDIDEYLTQLYYWRWVDNKDDEYFHKSVEHFLKIPEYLREEREHLYIFNNSDEEDYFDKAKEYFLKGLELGYEEFNWELCYLYVDKFKDDGDNFDYLLVAENYYDKLKFDNDDCGIGDEYFNLWMNNKANQEYYDKAEKFYLKNEDNYSLCYLYFEKWKDDKTNDELFYKLEELNKYRNGNLIDLYYAKWQTNINDYTYYHLLHNTYLKMLDKNFNKNLSSVFRKLEFIKIKEYCLTGIKLGYKMYHKQLANVYLREWSKDKSKYQYFKEYEKQTLKAIKNGEKDLYFTLGQTFVEQITVREVNKVYFKKAKKYLLKAEKYNPTDAYDRLGALYHNLWRANTYRTRYFKNAEMYFLKAIELGNKRAYNNLGNLYSDKYYVSKDEYYYAKAEENYLIYVENNGQFEQTSLGFLYYRAWLLDKSTMSYFNKAEQCFLKSLKVARHINGKNLYDMYFYKWLQDKSNKEYFVKTEDRCLIEIEHRNEDAKQVLENLYRYNKDFLEWQSE